MRSCLENRVWKWRSLSGAHHQQHLSSAAFPLFLTLVFLFIATVFTSSDLLALGVSFRGCCVQNHYYLCDHLRLLVSVPFATNHSSPSSSLSTRRPLGSSRRSVFVPVLRRQCDACEVHHRIATTHSSIAHGRLDLDLDTTDRLALSTSTSALATYSFPRPASAHLLRRLTGLLGIALLAQPPLSALLRLHFAHYFRACGSPHSAGLRIRFGKHHSLTRS